MELLEREQFFAEMAASLTEVAAGNGRLVLLSGEAGIGKTALVEQFTEQHKKQVRVLWGACDALFTPRPLGPLYDIAHKTQSKLFALLEEEAPRASVFSAVLDELEDSGALSIMVIEDVHWADEATLDLLKFLGRRIIRMKAMLVVTYRDDEVSVDHPLKLVLGDLPRRSTTHLRLTPLTEAGVNTLAQLAGRRIEQLYEVTGGNPFFVTEVLASKQQGVPFTVRDAVLSRAARLSSTSRAVLELVSVVPARAEMWLLDDTIKADATTLEGCVSAGMLRYESEAIAFRHELARRAVEDSLTVPHRKSLHAQVLKTLVNRNSDALLARIVHHAAQAGDGAALLNYAPIAARQAANLSAHRESASHYQTALRYAGTLAPGHRAELLECRSYECYLTDQIEEALKARREALEIRKQLGDKLRQGDDTRWMSRFAWALGRNKEAEVLSIEAVRILESLPSGAELAMAYSNRAQLHMLADEFPQALLWGSRAIELAEKLGATETLVHALNNVGTVELDVFNERGRIKLEESLHLALANNLQDHVARAYTNLGFCWLRARNYPLAFRYFDDGIDYTTEHDLDSYKLYMTACRARAHLEQGNWDSAANDADSVLGHYRVLAIAKVTALAVLGHVRVRRGDPDVAPILDEAREMAMQTGELQRIWPVASARAEFAWLKGSNEQVMNEARSVLEMARGRDHPWLHGELVFWMWRAGSVFETADRVAEPYGLQMSGDWRGAAALWKEIGCPYEEAMALADGDAGAQLAALEIFERLGAGPAAERLRQALRAKGVRGIPRGPRSSTKENPAGLTNRQIEVLALMIDGLSNAEIGDRLFISPKTVDHHVSAILTKLDAHTRAEAVSLALQSGLINKK